MPLWQLSLIVIIVTGRHHSGQCFCFFWSLSEHGILFTYTVWILQTVSITTLHFPPVGEVTIPIILVNPLYLTHPHCFRSCGPSQHRARAPTPVLRPLPRPRAVAGLILKTLHVLEGGRKAEEPEEVHANMGRAFKLHSESGSWDQTSDLLALR